MSTSRSINLVTFDCVFGKPSCEEHGAMLCLNPEGTMWRCPTCHVGIVFKRSDFAKLERLIRELIGFYGFENEAVLRLKAIMKEENEA